MSEVFGLPVIEGNFVNEHTRRVCDQKGVFAMSNISASSRVAHAINNHDRLVEEIAQLEADYKKEFNDAEDLRCVIEDLKADKAELLEFVEMIANTKVYTVEISSQYGGTDEMDCLCDSLKGKAKNVLQKHKG